MITAREAKDLTISHKKTPKVDPKDKEYEDLIKYINKEILKESKKGRSYILLETNCRKGNLDKLEKYLTELGYNVIIRGPFIMDFGHYEVRVIW